jgi:HAD superfamily hydrolase (TIGR01484 family)
MRITAKRPGIEDREDVLAPPLPAEFLDEMRRRNVTPRSLGRIIFATWRPQETIVLEVIQQFGLDCQIIFNKRAVMVLPSGVNKATGLDRALQALGISPQNVVGIGDAENDHAFLDACGCAVAVDNALPALKSP